MDGNGFNGQGALDTTLNVAGRGVGAIAALADLYAHRDPFALLGARNQLLQDPGFRSSAGPFLSGLVQIGGGRAPDVGPGMAQNVMQRAGIAPGQFVPNFGPLPPEKALESQLSGTSLAALRNATPQQRAQIGLGALGIKPSIADQLAALPGWKPVRVGPQGVSLVPTGETGAAQPIAGAPGYVQWGGKPLRLPAEKGDGGDVNTEFKLWRRDNPKGTFADYQSAKASGAATRQTQVDVAKAAALTNATKTMVEAAPKVVHFVDRIEKDLDKVATGPAASRYQEFMAGRIGAPNPDFTRYRTNVGLLTTLLLRMHVGARGGQQMLEHFTSLLNAGTQSAENMRAALDEIRAYAGDVAATPRPGGPPSPAEAGAPPAPGDMQTTPGGNSYRVLEP